MKKMLAAMLVFCTFMTAALWSVGTQLTAPANHPVGQAPITLDAESVTFNGVHGWFTSVDHPSMCVLLLHGVRSNRQYMVPRAVFLKKSGFASLMIDLQAHGESPGKNITFGYRESNNAEAAVSYLRNTRGCKKVAAIGISLGGAASLLGTGPIKVEALILESVYPTIEDAVTDRLAIRIGRLAPLVAPLLTNQIPYRLNVPLAGLRPIDAIKNNHAPVLVIGGGVDRHTKPEETQQLYSHALNPKELWIIPGAAHEDFYKYAGVLYEQRIIAFLKKYL